MYPPQTPAALPPSQPSAVAAPPRVSKIDDTPIPMTPDELAGWWTWVELAIAQRKARETRWQELLDAYLPPKDPKDLESINSNTHFRNTEQKKSSIYYRDAALILTPLEPLADKVTGPDGQVHTAEDVVAIKQAVLNKLLGRDGVNLKRLADEVLFEILQVSGFGPTKIAYECDTVEVDGDPDPLTGQVQKVPVPVYEEWTWKKFSSKKLLVPHDWRSTRYDEAPAIGFQGVKPLAIAKREKLVPEDFDPNATSDPYVFRSGTTTTETSPSAELVEFVEIWYRPAFFNTGITHRQVMRRLVLVKGLEQPAKHVKSPYQTLGPDGKLTADSLIGFPIHIFTLRDQSDSAYVNSDAAMTDPLVRQENIWASQDIKARDANIPKFLFDERIKTALEKLALGDYGDGAGVDQATLAQGMEKLIAQLPHLEKAISDTQGRESIQRRIDQTLALGPNTSGSVTDTVRSATELSIASQSSNARLKAEQDRFLGDILMGVRKFDALVQRFATETDYVTWVGQDGTRRMAAWNQSVIAGRFAYDAKPDSQLSIDEAQQRQQDIQITNLMAQAPEANRVAMLRDLARSFGKDPATWIGQPPPKQPDTPKISLSLAPADFVGPTAPIAAEFMRIAGTPLNPQALQAAGTFAQVWAEMQAATAAQPAQPQTEHGGALDSNNALEPVSKHQSAITGQPTGRPTLQ